ncbi:MAG: UvrD-helicase domain-containing protein [Eubacteriales bacterium]|nr:UvrD-helicase domain-containing protein [Eubacteriales bacterium]
MVNNRFTVSLNDKQKEAVLHTEGPLLILAGAGSGKTRVLTHRIGYLIDHGVMPWQILAITFTNKAAREMRERVDALLEGKGVNVFVSTFHSMCVRILRRDIERLGFSSDFTIYDGDDQKTLMRQVIKNLELDPKMYRERAVLSKISSLKNEMIDEDEYFEEASDYYERNIAKIYKEYEVQKKKNNALDFDDLLLMTVKLWKENPDVLRGWQERFHYIMVDEYQDTNTVQFEIVRLLSAASRNICVVGDDDQSIYKFRGANIENILSFERSFHGAYVIKLEQNYRSTKSILDAANAVIKNNKGRKEKSLWTENDKGELPVYKEYDTAGIEADSVIREISESNFPLSSQTILYRTNAQSRLLEEKCIKRNIPYVIVGGVNFYQRKEIKDILSYLRIMANDVDDLALERIINVPKRGIGNTTLDKVRKFAALNNISMYEALKKCENINGIGSAAKRIQQFVNLIEGFRQDLSNEDISLKFLIEKVRDESGYAEELRKEGEIEAKTRMENIEELINKAVSYEENNDGTEKTLGGFLEEVSLIADIDRTSDDEDVLTMMTLHSAKGLEFDKVYICGMEEGLFPSSMSINSEDPEAEIEEERRLCYVGFTRARKELKLTSARERMVNGETRYCKVSRFIEEVPDELMKKEFKKQRAASWEDYDDDYDNPIPKRGFSKQNEFAKNYGGFGSPSPSYISTPQSKRIMGNFGSLDTGIGLNKGNKFTNITKGIVKSRPSYEIGDRVSHIKFGEGTVADILEGKKDYEVTVNFDSAGTKKMFAGFAKLVKI